MSQKSLKSLSKVSQKSHFLSLFEVAEIKRLVNEWQCHLLSCPGQLKILYWSVKDNLLEISIPHGICLLNCLVAIDNCVFHHRITDTMQDGNAVGKMLKLVLWLTLNELLVHCTWLLQWRSVLGHAVYILTWNSHEQLWHQIDSLNTFSLWFTSVIADSIKSHHHHVL